MHDQAIIDDMAVSGASDVTGLAPPADVTLRWEENALVMWGNRSTQHAAFDYPGHHRRLQRVTILDSEPWPGSDS